jgi:uncharacterized protein DUF4255
VIHDVDESLRTMIREQVVNRSDIDVVFDAPTKDWAGRRTGPTINVFLYDIREDVGRRDVAVQAVRDANGRVVGRRPPDRRFRLAYLLTAWTQRPEDEHRLLSALLGTFLAHDRIPDDMLVGGLVDHPLPVILQLALPPSQDRSLSDVWSALGGEMKPSLDLVVVAPIDPLRRVEPGPPVLEAPGLQITRRAGPGLAEEVDGGDGERPGRTLRLHRYPRDGRP